MESIYKELTLLFQAIIRTIRNELSQHSLISKYIPISELVIDNTLVSLLHLPPIFDLWVSSDIVHSLLPPISGIMKSLHIINSAIHYDVEGPL